MPTGENWNPIELFKRGEKTLLLNGQYWNYSKANSLRANQTTIGLAQLPQIDLWLLFHVGRVTRDLGVIHGVGYEYECIPELEKFCGRVVIRYKNRVQNLVRKARSVLEECEVSQILPDVFDNDLFPGYDNIDLAWSDLKRILSKDVWITALQNQKGVYLLTDSSNGKMYVGSAYGDFMLLGRWQSYARSGHGGNVELRKLEFEHIRKYFRYSILEIFKASTSDERIIERETWWKEILQTRRFGYNAN